MNNDQIIDLLSGDELHAARATRADLERRQRNITALADDLADDREEFRLRLRARAEDILGPGGADIDPYAIATMSDEGLAKLVANDDASKYSKTSETARADEARAEIARRAAAAEPD